MAVKKAKKAKPTVRVRKVALKTDDIVRIVAAPDVHPLVVHKEPGIVEIVPLPTHQPKAAKKMGWWEYLMGY